MVMLDAEQVSEPVAKLSALLRAREMSITTVESCTGGLLSAILTATAGSSLWFDRGFVTYSNLAKMQMVQVKPQTLKSFGAVSVEVAQEMAIGGLQQSAAGCVVSITGIAGPDGGSKDKPVGTVCFGWAGFSAEPIVRIKWFSGNRNQVRSECISYVLQRSIEFLRSAP